jgi:hypothetical protein
MYLSYNSRYYAILFHFYLKINFEIEYGTFIKFFLLIKSSFYLENCTYIFTIYFNKICKIIIIIIDSNILF